MAQANNASPPWRPPSPLSGYLGRDTNRLYRLTAIASFKVPLRRSPVGDFYYLALTAFMPCSRPCTAPWGRAISVLYSICKPEAFVMDMAAAHCTVQNHPDLIRPFSHQPQSIGKPCQVTTAVPCWSSWKIGISQISAGRLSISKASGCRDILQVNSAKLPGNQMGWFLRFHHILTFSIQSGKASTSPNVLNKTHLPSITGIPASGPISLGSPVRLFRPNHQAHISIF